MLRVWLTVVLLQLVRSQEGDVLVNISTGMLKGQSFLLPDIIPGGKVINRFHGIPYANPPVGELRFTNPQPKDPWEGVLSADRLPDACPQGFGILALTHPLWTRFNEDCLYINVFAPNDTSSAPYPVMVYFHGGGYTGSANIQHPGHFQAGYDVVVVVPNYRLGALGFMSTGDDVAPGNWGFKDQVMALQWVRDNIAAFGGDPNQVTLYGQSAGASSIGLHMMSPYSRNLFHGAIFASGNELAVWAINGEEQAPQNYTKEVAEQLGCPTTDSVTMMECLKTIDADDLIGTGFDCAPGFYCQGFAPVIDGDYIPYSPFVAREQGLIADVPILAGICREDGSPYTLILIPEAGDGGFSREEFLRLLEEELVSIFSPLFPDRVEEVTQAFAFFYSPWPDVYNESLNRAMINNMTTDFGFGVGLDTQLKYHSAMNPNTYMYIMGYRTKHRSAEILYPPWMGVPHNGELPYVIGFPMYQESWALRTDAQIIDVVRWDEEDQDWALYMMQMWTNFAKFGNPTPTPVPAPDTSDTTWPLWNNNTQEYLYLDRTMEVRLKYRQKNVAFWLDYLNYVSGGLNFGPDIQYKAPERKEGGKKLSSKAMEEMYRRLVAPRLEELLGMKVSLDHRPHGPVNEEGKPNPEAQKPIKSQKQRKQILKRKHKATKKATPKH